MKFKTKLKGNRFISLYNVEALIEPEFKKKLMDVHEAEAIVHWNLEFEAREWGIKGTYISISKIELEFDWEDYDGNENNYGFDNILNTTLGFKLLDIDHTKLDSGLITIKDLDIDFETKEIEATF